jgi:hypothetical protein
VGGAEDEVFVDLVRDHQQIALDGEGGDGGQLVVGEDGAGGVVRGVEQDEAGAVGDRVAQLVQVEAEGAVVRAEGDRDAGAARHRDARRVRVVVRLQRDHLVARLQQGQQRGGDGLGGARGDQHLGVGVAGQPVEALLVFGDGGTQFGDARAGRVLVAAAVAQGAHRGLAHLFGAVGVGKALAQVDGTGTHGEGGHLGEDRGAECRQSAVEQRSFHGPILRRTSGLPQLRF